ncbi:hypothetical protein BV20DRAFT_80248 [Pilatotrama ljubarskyi]|nr:hypothetical protein BV20DRAFT_80248 [Pilatotrama ljubarskyi]
MIASFQACTTQEPWQVDLRALLAYLPQFEQYAERLKRDGYGTGREDTVKAVGALTTYLRKEHSAMLNEVAELTSRGEITFDTLFAIFVPQTILVTKCAITGEWQALKLRSAAKVQTPSTDVYDLLCKSIDVDDSPHCACCTLRGTSSSNPSPGAKSQNAVVGDATVFARVQRRILIPRFNGAVRISALAAFPPKYHPDAGRLEASLIARGRRWLALQGIHYVLYHGVAACTVAVGECTTMVKYAVCVSFTLRATAERLDSVRSTPSFYSIELSTPQHQ